MREADGEDNQQGMVGQSRAADERDRIAGERDALAEERDALAREREQAADDVEAALAPLAPSSAQAILDALAANSRARATNDGNQRTQADRSRAAAAPPAADWELDKREFVADDRQHQANRRDFLADERERLADLREEILRDLAVAVGLDAARRGAPALGLSTDGDRAERSRARTARDDAGHARELADHDSAATRRSTLAADLVAVAQALVHADTIDGALDEVVQAATRTIGGCNDATFSMVAPGDEIVTPAAAHPAGPGLKLALAQYQAAEGPCLDAIRAEAVIATPDVTADPRWPGLRALAIDTPCRAVLSVPVVDERHHVVLGALCCYSYAAEGLDDSDAECAVLLAAHLGAVMALALDAAAAGRRVVELGHAVQTRDVIGQAKGILMERQHLTAEQAFDVLRRASQRLNRKLVDIADELASTGALTVEQD
ncbi:MAG TPA: ANTAR domain-containing protein [Acidimicrobiales bacterium]|nr:ANTAR domain-containing protein [Acidimicrobiales bacterium]